MTPRKARFKGVYNRYRVWMSLRELIEQRNKQWAAFHDWEAAQPLEWRDPSGILADVSAIWNWLPREVREKDPDPEKHGVRAMHAALAHLKTAHE